MEAFPPIPQTERRFAYTVTGLVLAALLSVVLFGYAVTPDGTRYIGTSITSPADNLIYYSYIEQARESGQAFFRNVFSQEPSAPSFFNPLWALLGYAAAVFQLPTPVAFTLALFASIFLFCLGLYRCLVVLVPVPAYRQAAFVLVLVGSGFGFVAAALHLRMPFGADFTTQMFFTFLHSPLFILSQLLLVLSFTLFLQTERSRIPRILLYAPVVLLAVLHPYDVVTLLAAGGVYGVVRFLREPGYRTGAWRQTAVTLLGIIAVSLPIGIYFWSLRWLDQGIGGWLLQNVTPSPPPVALALGFTSFILVASVSLAYGWHARGRRLTVLIAWAAAVPVLMYLPLPFQSRFENGWVICLAALAAPLIAKVVSGYKRPVFFVWLAFLILAFLPTTLYTYLSTYRLYVHSAEGKHVSVYPTQDFLDAVTWLRMQPRRVLLSQYATSRVASALSLQPSFQADSHQTLDYPAKAAAWTQLLANPASLREFFEVHGITYYLETPAERLAFPKLHQAAQQNLQIVFLRPNVTVYTADSTKPQ